MFKLEIDTGNAAFEDESRRVELARILRELADDLIDGSRETGGLYDINGNRVGTWNLTHD